MDENVKIQIPAIFDDPISGRCSFGFPIFYLYDYVIIKHGRIGLKRAYDSRPKETIKLNEIENILSVKRTVTSWKRGGKLDAWGKNGTEMEISLKLKDGNIYILIPNFFLLKGIKDWDWFLNELCDSTGLPLEEIMEKQKKKV